MKSHSGRSSSVWVGTESTGTGALSRRKISADVGVIGAGIAGLSTAYELARQGKSVVVLDAGPIGGGESGRTTAHLTTALDDRYFELERLHGKEGARLAAESHAAAIDRIEAIVAEEKIDCQFERLDGYLLVAPGAPAEVLDRELEAAGRAGLAGIEKTARAPLAYFDTGACLRFPRQAQFHPTQYLQALAGAIERYGGRIHTNTQAVKVEGGSPARIETKAGGAVTCDSIVVAANTPVNDWIRVHTKQAAYRSYVIGVEVPAGSVTKALYWDTADPYHYVRLVTTAKGELLLVGGEDHKTGQADDAEDRYGRLKSWARERFPMLGKIRFRWSGQIIEPVDRLAFIGRNPGDHPNVYIATGTSGNGMTYGVIAGLLLTDLMVGRDNSWTELYQPSRIILRAASEFAQETLNFVAQYADWLPGGDTDSVDRIVPDSGAIVQRGLKKIAAYRDPQGVLHERSAVCPHLGCVVTWNSGEKTWDCPCHGSRFDSKGKVVNGPALGDLAELEANKEPEKAESKKASS